MSGARSFHELQRPPACASARSEIDVMSLVRAGDDSEMCGAVEEESGDRIFICTVESAVKGRHVAFICGNEKPVVVLPLHGCHTCHCRLEREWRPVTSISLRVFAHTGGCLLVEGLCATYYGH